MNEVGENRPNVEVASLVVIARATRTRGLKGEVMAELLTDFPDRFQGLSRLFAMTPGSEPRTLQLESHWFQKDRVVLKFVGYDTIEAAQALVGQDFAVLESESVRLAEHEYYDWELEGCKVETLTGEPVGIVMGVMRTGGVHLLEVVDDEGNDSLIPMVAEIMLSVDKKLRSIVIDPPEGLLEL
jgi:16S rRNA processing protein RimM